MARISFNHHLYRSGCPNRLRHILNDLARASKYIVHSIRTGDLGLAGTSNLYGEEQLALDVLADKIISYELEQGGLTYCYASEEMGEIKQICVSDRKKINSDDKRMFSVVYDPLDGSSLVDVNLAIGTIFGIYESNKIIGEKPKNQVAAMYVMYGPRITLVYTIGKGVHEFTLNDIGEYHLSKENLKIKKDTHMFSAGNLRACRARPDYKKLVDYWIKNKYTLRYSGGMVPDINAVLLKGEGIFSYPGYPEKPEGKLRLLFECGPMAKLFYEAGGIATDGKISILDKKINALDQRTPIFIGSKTEVERAEKFLSKEQ